MYLLLRDKGSSCYGKSRCETCLNIKETNSFQKFVTKNLYKINHHFHCDIKCIAYLQSCKVCGLQYVGSTVDRFRLKWNYCAFVFHWSSLGVDTRISTFVSEDLMFSCSFDTLTYCLTSFFYLVSRVFNCD